MDSNKKRKLRTGIMAAVADDVDIVDRNLRMDAV